MSLNWTITVDLDIPDSDTDDDTESLSDDAVHGATTDMVLALADLGVNGTVRVVDPHGNTISRSVVD